jgi:5-methylcytosine-specific restriction enzyme subunit McrC
MGLLAPAAATESADTPGFLGRIPVRNLWLLMLYASDLFRAGGTAKLDVEESPDDLPDLVAQMLARAVETRLHRQLSLGYRSQEEWLSRVRGRIDVMTTERRQLLDRGLVACRYAELTIDTPRNRFVRAALESVARLVKRPAVAHRCRSLAAAMKARGVAGQPPTRAQVSADRFGRHDADDQFMVAASKLALDLALPTESAGGNALAMPDREEAWVRRLFERAVGGLYAVALSPLGWHVRCGAMLQWQISSKTEGVDGILPGMRTDVVLDQANSGRRIVIDTKFNCIVTAGWYREQSLRSGYIYQMYAYLLSQVGLGDPRADTASGLLLHPSVGKMIDETVVIQGHPIRFATVDLAASPAEIRAQMLGCVEMSC